MSEQQVVLRESYDPETFTDREREWDYLVQWAEEIPRYRTDRGIAIISHRRVGKTALLEKLYNALFSSQGKVIPFYFRCPELPLSYRSLAERLIHCVVWQYLAFKLNNPKLVKLALQTGPIEEAKALAQENNFEILNKFIERALAMAESGGEDNYFYHATLFANTLLTTTGEFGVFMLDEFQLLNQYAYHDDHLTRLMPETTQGFKQAAESRQCPLIVAGSQVHFLMNNALGGALTGRFRPMALDPLSPSASLELIEKLARVRQVEISKEAAQWLAQATGGNPFYLTAILKSNAPAADFRTVRGMQEVYAYEVGSPQGEIRYFWEERFKLSMEALNGNDLARQILLAMIYHRQEVIGKRFRFKPEDLAKYLRAEPTEVAQRLRLLAQADFIEESGIGFYVPIPDKTMHLALRTSYAEELPIVSRNTDYSQQILALLSEELEVTRDEIAGLKEREKNLTQQQEDLGKRLGTLTGQVSVIKGKLLEQRWRDLLRQARGYKVTGEILHAKTNAVTIPTFTLVEARQIGEQGGLQFDLWAENKEDLWVGEAKAWQKPVDISEVEAFLRKVRSLTTAHTGEKRVQAWLLSLSGVTAKAAEALADASAWWTDARGLLALELAVTGDAVL